jgi:transposase-like protein
MGRNRKAYPAALKVKVALAALKGDKTLAQLASEFGVHPNQIQEWKKRLLAEAPAIFATRRSHAEREAEVLQAELYRQIGQLKVEWDWLKKRVETGP